MGEQGSYLPPQRTSAVPALKGPVEQAATAQLDMIDQKRQRHQVHQHRRQMFMAVTIIVFKAVALVLQRVEGLVLYLPAGSSHPHQLHQVRFGDLDIAHPGKMPDPAVGAVFPIPS